MIYIPSRSITTTHYYQFDREMCAILCHDSIDLTAPEYQIHQQVLVENCGQYQIPFLNLTDVIRSHEEQGNHLYWNYDDHMRVKGYRILAEAIYRWWNDQ